MTRRTQMTWDEAAEQGLLMCIVDGSRGIYVPQFFAQAYGDRCKGLDAEDLEILLAGPDHEHYWETWDIVDGELLVTDDAGHKWHVMQDDGDLFLVAADVEITDER